MIENLQNPTLLPAVTPPPALAPATAAGAAEAPVNPRKKLWDEFLSRITSCKTYRKKLIPNWTTSIDFRRAKPFASQVDDDRVVVPLDWSMTKAKQASLFSQMPQVRVSHTPETISVPWIHSFEQRLNDTLVLAGLESAMDECLPDVINASGIAGVLVAHESITEMKDVPVMDPASVPGGVMPDGSPIPTTQVPQVIDHRYTITRISPSDLLWPINFTGSDFDNAPWVGRSGRVTWAVAMKIFNLTEEDKSSVLGDDRSTVEKLTHDIDKDKIQPEEMVSFDEIFYKEFQYNPDAKSYSTIIHLVFVHGKDEPVVDEPWKGQQIDPKTNSIVGATKSPIRYLTLDYISDESIPPSSSAIGRSQVNEINKSRTQMVMQRERSIPIRWFDVNRVDQSIQHTLMRGKWQAMIPVQGQGQNIIGEVAKANMPQENFNFDRIAKSDLTEIWSIGPNQLGGGKDIDTKGEAQVIESNFQTRVGRERAKVVKFVCTIAEVLGGIMCISEPPESFGQGFDPALSKALSFSILADSTVLLDSNQRLQRLINFVNFTGKSGFLNMEPVLKEIATLSGLDPSVVIVPPQPKPPVEPTISLRFTGIEDMANPLALAFLLKSGQAPEPELIEKAKLLISQAVITPMPIPPATPGPSGPDGKPGAPVGGEINFTPNLPNLQPSGGAAPPNPVPPPPEVGHANPDWSGMPRVNKRTEGEGGGDPNVQ